MSKYPEDKPFGEWTPEQQREFKIDTRVDGKRWETKWAMDDYWKTPVEGNVPHYAEDSFYRLAPEPEIPDSIDWSHVHPDAVKMRRFSNWKSSDLKDINDDFVGGTNGFASYKRGNMKECTVYRPGFEPEGEE